ncbi:C6 transcription factor [Seiridium cupressi]
MSSTRAAFLPPSSAVPNGSERQEGPDDFWEDLVQEVEQLRDIVTLKPGEADSEIAQAPAQENFGSSDGGFMALGLSSSTTSPADWQWIPNHISFHQDKDLASQLCGIYLDQVDPIIKILHRPSLSRWMMQGQTYMKYPDQHPSAVALAAAVCYSSANSMTEDQSRAIFNIEKSGMVADCRKACESAIEKSGLLTTRDITALQAFVLYLAARASAERTRAVWTLVATAVRIAKALRLHVDLPIGTPGCRTFFDQQLRNRLWLTISVMDLQTSLAHASKPLIGIEEVTSSITLVKHINDSDFEPTTIEPVPEREDLTDITFALVKFHLQVYGRQIGEGRGPTSFVAGLQLKWERAQQHAQQFEQKALHLLHFCDPESSPYAWFTWHSTQLFVAGGRLAALRPLHRAQLSGEEAPPRLTDNKELLHQTIRALEKIELMHTDPRAERFRWMVSIQWHILAIAIAECYVCTDRVLALQAWTLIESLYQRYESVLTKHSGGHLQGPLGQLMSRTREKLAISAANDYTVPYTTRTQPQALKPTSPKPGTRLLDPSNDASPKTTVITDVTSLSLDDSRTPETLLDQAQLTSVAADLGFNPDDTVWDQSWKLWEEFMCDVSFDDLNNADSFP